VSGVRVPALLHSGSVPVPTHEPKPSHGEEQHRYEGNDRDDFVAVERHMRAPLSAYFLGAGGVLGATGFVRNSSIAEMTVQ
jgi:hypothetical protein